MDASTATAEEIKAADSFIFPTDRYRSMVFSIYGITVPAVNATKKGRK